MPVGEASPGDGDERASDSDDEAEGNTDADHKTWQF